MSNETCKVCGRERGHMNDEARGTCGRLAQESFGGTVTSRCYRLGYTRELAAREAAALFRVEVALLAAAFEEWSRRCGAAEKDATTRDARYSATVKESIWHEAAGELYRALEKFPETKP